MRPLIIVITVIFGALAGVGMGGASAPAAAADPPSFEDWLGALRDDALAAGVSATVFDAALAGVQPNPRVIELDRRQPESRLTFARYVELVLPQSRKDAARNRLEENRDLLNRIGRHFGVQPRFIVTLWGVESDFGRNTGGFSVIRSLATLAYDPRRRDFFRAELIHALKILSNGDIAADAMTGSWAGAMGQSQFMPSSYHAYAYDWDGDGRRDIWTTRADVFASIANYLRAVGWRDDQTWGRPVRIPAALDRSLIGLEVRKIIPEWQAIGVRRIDGGDLPTRPLESSLLEPDGPSGPGFMVYSNFRTTLKWNRSHYFALAVGLLSDSLIGK